jgi:hypothetical protein
LDSDKRRHSSRKLFALKDLEGDVIGSRKSFSYQSDYNSSRFIDFLDIRY